MSTQRTEAHGVTITSGDPQALPVAGPRLHVRVLAVMRDAGIVGAGWLADTPQSIAAIMLDRETGPSVELLRDMAVALTSDLADAFNIPQEAGASRAFIFFLPGRPRQWAGGLPLEVHHTGGAIEHCFAPATGHFSEIGRILDLAPPDQALLLAERLLTRWDGADGGTLPPEIETWMARLHQRIGRQPGVSGGIDEAVRVGTSGILLRGRLPRSAQDEGAIRLVSLSGRRLTLETPLPALDESRFAVFAAILGLRPDERFWFLEISAVGGRVERIPFLCPAPPPALRGIETALALLEPPLRDPERVLEHAVAPAVDNFWLAAHSRAPAPTTAAYGEAAGAPQVSVIVPLDGGIDRMRHQIAQFSNDPEFRSGATVELIYLVDDISVTEELRRLSQSLYDIYGVPFRTLTLDRSAGRAAAGNAGARAASGSALLFLDADVLPKRSRWVGRLSHSYDALERCGVLGCRLLFEDGSIRHSGITFRAATSLPGLWEEYDPSIGLPCRFEPGRGAVRVPAVTGACLMIDRVLFHELGGFAEEYLFGEFADCDLCLAAQQHGRRVYCTPEVELYQLAAAAPAGTARWQERLTRYNRWKHSRRWRGVIPTVLAAAET